MTALATLRDAGVLSSLDVHFARTLERLSPNQPQAVLLGAAFASRAVSQGHVCADLRRILERPLVNSEGEVVDLPLPTIFEWVIQLGGSDLCNAANTASPLVFDGEARLYLRRYWTYEQRLAHELRVRATSPRASLSAQEAETMGQALARLFRTDGDTPPDPRQQLAALCAARHRLAVISGGPGTGKTTTVVRVLALLIEQALARGDAPPRILLLAPTGKAAARLGESIRAGRARLDCTAAVREAIPDDATTIHRRLGMRPGHPTQFFHRRDHRLAADVILVDEASMVDLALMTKLIDATPTTAKVIFLGDKNQLASVEAGAILGDICNVDATGGCSTALAEDVHRVLGPAVAATVHPTRDAPGIWDCVVELTRSFRFRDDGGIGRLARAINEGRGADAVDPIQRGSDAQVKLVELTRADDLTHAIGPLVLRALRPMLEATDPRERLERLADFRLLAAHRRGPFGTESLNRRIEDLLRAQGLVGGAASTDAWYDGRPVMVTQNDYQLELFNGDTGIIVRPPGREPRAYFEGTDGQLRSFLPARLPPHESVFAMTVHKSQGSEFREVGVLMPPQASALLTRELVYTAVTRAKESVHVLGDASVLRDAIHRRIDRASGLRDALWLA